MSGEVERTMELEPKCRLISQTSSHAELTFREHSEYSEKRALDRLVDALDGLAGTTAKIDE